jgi:NAD+ kinase
MNNTYTKIHFVFDKKSITVNKKLKFFKKFKKYSPQKANLIVVLGGDGFMLQVLKKLRRFNKPFYGMNTGTYGFLMNKFKTKKIIENIPKSRPITISALQMIAKTKNNIIKRGIAINEISMLRQSKQTASLQIKKGKKIIMKKLTSDGVLVSTPAGSTAYNLSVHGPILSLNSKKLAITPISPFRPRRWKGSIVSDRSVISINNLNIKKRPVSVVADNLEFRNIKNVKIYVNHKIKFNLLYDSKNSLNKKIKIEQVRKEIN